MKLTNPTSKLIGQRILVFVLFALSITLAKSQISLLESGSGKPVDPRGQTVYGGGGETKTNRLTDIEKSLDFIKGRLVEIDDLKKRVTELEERLQQKGASSSANTNTVKDTGSKNETTPKNMFIRGK
ncbi:MAG: hypothetical protein QE271_07580 [Bacteriovoracaceae bacterium]|nr:hypothetical protein [Bacteriovoracaceae bacterium]